MYSHSSNDLSMRFPCVRSLVSGCLYLADSLNAMKCCYGQTCKKICTAMRPQRASPARIASAHCHIKCRCIKRRQNQKTSGLNGLKC